MGSMKVETFFNEFYQDLDKEINTWLEKQGDAIEIVDRKYVMGGEVNTAFFSTQIWYQGVPVARHCSSEDFKQDGKNSAKRHYPRILTDRQKIETYVRRMGPGLDENYVTNFADGYLEQVQEYQTVVEK